MMKGKHGIIVTISLQREICNLDCIIETDTFIKGKLPKGNMQKSTYYVLDGVTANIIKLPDLSSKSDLLATLFSVTEIQLE